MAVTGRQHTFIVYIRSSRQKVCGKKRNQKNSTKEGLTGRGYRITGPNGMHVKHVIGLYTMLGLDDFCKMMMITCGIQDTGG